MGTVSKKNTNPIHFSTREVLKAKDITLQQKQNCLEAPYFQLFGSAERGKRYCQPHYKCSSVVCIPLFHFICPDDYWLFKWNRELLSFTVVVSVPVSGLLDGAHLRRYRTLQFREAGCAWKGAAETLGQGLLWNDSLPGCDGSKDQCCLQE